MDKFIGYCYQCDRTTIFAKNPTKAIIDAGCRSCGYRVKGFWGIRISWEIRDLCPEERRKLWEDFLGEKKDARA